MTLGPKGSFISNLDRFTMNVDDSPRRQAPRRDKLLPIDSPKAKTMSPLSLSKFLEGRQKQKLSDLNKSMSTMSTSCYSQISGSCHLGYQALKHSKHGGMSMAKSVHSAETRQILNNRPVKNERRSLSEHRRGRKRRRKRRDRRLEVSEPRIYVPSTGSYRTTFARTTDAFGEQRAPVLTRQASWGDLQPEPSSIPQTTPRPKPIRRESHVSSFSGVSELSADPEKSMKQRALRHECDARKVQRTSEFHFGDQYKHTNEEEYPPKSILVGRQPSRSRVVRIMI